MDFIRNASGRVFGFFADFLKPSLATQFTYECIRVQKQLAAAKC